MNTHKLLWIVYLLALLGCAPSGGAGDVAGARKAIEALPKSGADLPQDIPPEARRIAERNIQQGHEAAQQAAAQGEAYRKAMEQMRRQ